MRFLHGIRTGGAALVLACVLTASARAQQLDQSAPVPRGTVAIRVANMTGCPMAIRATTNGRVAYISVIDTNVVRRVFARPDTNALEVEILASPRLCGIALPDPSQPASMPPPGVPLRRIQRAGYRPGLHRFPVHSSFATRETA